MPDIDDLTATGLDSAQDLTEERDVPCSRLIGSAGVGKTHTLMSRTKDDPAYGHLTSTTGVSAVNMGAITIHSTLRYSDTASLRDAFLSGRLARVLHDIALEKRRLIVEEYSMVDADQLDLWYRGAQEANRYRDVQEPLGIMLVGDLAQLPVVNGKWVFEAACWPQFADNTERLTHVWRQDEGPFLDALNFLRVGNGDAAAEVLTAAGAQWETQLDTEFTGTTILPENKMVNRYNEMGLDRVPGPRVRVTASRWGMQRGEWGQNRRSQEWGIPPTLELKVGAYVTIKSNATDFSVVNGDSGFVTAYVPATKLMEEHFVVRILRTGQERQVFRIVRGVEVRERPDAWYGDAIPKLDDDGSYIPRKHYRGKARRYVLGQITFFPIAPAYASTVHRSQSLTLDRVQCDYRGWFFGKEAMLYVSLSRCRTLAGLRLVGGKETFAKRCKMEAKVRPWI